MNIHEFKINYLQNNSQFVFFENTGKVVQSCDTFYHLKDKILFDELEFLKPFVEKIFSIKLDKEFVIPIIEIPQSKEILNFIFNFVSISQKNYYLMIIRKEEECFSYLAKVQQERNEAILALKNLKVEKTD